MTLVTTRLVTAVLSALRGDSSFRSTRRIHENCTLMILALLAAAVIAPLSPAHSPSRSPRFRATAARSSSRSRIQGLLRSIRPNTSPLRAKWQDCVSRICDLPAGIYSALVRGQLRLTVALPLTCGASVTPPGLSSRMMPAAASSSRMRSDSANSFAAWPPCAAPASARSPPSTCPRHRRRHGTSPPRGSRPRTSPSCRSSVRPLSAFATSPRSRALLIVARQLLHRGQIASGVLKSSSIAASNSARRRRGRDAVDRDGQIAQRGVQTVQRRLGLRRAGQASSSSARGTGSTAGRNAAPRDA